MQYLWTRQTINCDDISLSLLLNCRAQDTVLGGDDFHAQKNAPIPFSNLCWRFWHCGKCVSIEENTKIATAVSRFSRFRLMRQHACGWWTTGQRELRMYNDTMLVVVDYWSENVWVLRIAAGWCGHRDTTNSARRRWWWPWWSSWGRWWSSWWAW